MGFGDKKMKKLEFPLKVYLDDDYRNNYLRSVKIEEYLNPQEMEKLKKMLDEIKLKKISAQELINELG
jgi:hypothetical protein